MSAAECSAASTSNLPRSDSMDSMLGDSLLDPPQSLQKIPPKRYQSPSRCGSPSLETPEHLLFGLPGAKRDSAYGMYAISAMSFYLRTSISLPSFAILLATQLLKNEGMFQTPASTVYFRPRTRQSKRPPASPDRTECAAETSTVSILASFTRSPPPPPPLVDRLVCPSRRDPTPHP